MSSKAILTFFILLAIGISIVFLFSIWPYREQDFALRSPIAKELRIFLYNETHHKNDPAYCWYDSGDYVIFAHRNTQALYYLSLAYKASNREDVKEDLRFVIERQLDCLQNMTHENIKQIRDQRNHSVLMPPLFDRWFFPQERYLFQEKEGRDIVILHALILKNIGIEDAEIPSLPTLPTNKTVSENCCEEGPLSLTTEEMSSLELLFSQKQKPAQGGWGINFTHLAHLQAESFDYIGSVLATVAEDFSNEPEGFHYIGGNYDIAGTIALEAFYRKKTGDTQFQSLSKNLWEYLHGTNRYGIHFVNTSHIHHPCGTWWGLCTLPQTLVNGVDETEEYNLKRKDIWRLTEAQLVGQAQYILASVLYNGF